MEEVSQLIGLRGHADLGTELSAEDQHTLHINALDQFTRGDPYVTFQESLENPFGNLSVAGLSVSISISATMRSIITGAAISVFSSLVSGAC